MRRKVGIWSVLGVALVAMAAMVSAASAEDAAPGTLTVMAVPWAHVEIDGQRVGTTPLVRHRVSPGRHHITLRTESGRTRHMTVDIRSGRETRQSVRLEDGAGTRETRRGEGRLMVNSTPWSAVTIDGRAMGNTPLTMSLAPGRHRVQLRSSTGTVQTMSVEIREGETTRLVRRFE